MDFQWLEIAKRLEAITHTGVETLNAAFFERRRLPDLSIERNTLGQILHMFNYMDDPPRLPYFD